MIKDTIKAREKRKKQINSIKVPRVEKFLRLPFKIELTPLSADDGGGYYACIPLLKGCQSDGTTPDEAIQNLREAQVAWLASALKHGDTIPLPR